jgi:hypothetical protein
LASAGGSLPSAAGGEWQRPVLAGLLLSIAGYTMEIAYPLLLFAWLFYGIESAVRTRRAGPALLRLLAFTGAFAALYLGFRLLVEQFVYREVVAFNDPLSHLAASWSAVRQLGLPAWLQARAADLAPRWFVAFPPLVSALALAGLILAPRRWLLWCLALIATFVAALAATKLLVRDLYLVYPAVYLLAAVGIDRIAQRTARLARLTTVRPVVAAALLLAAVAQTNADLWHDYFLPVGWFAIQ